VFNWGFWLDLDQNDNAGASAAAAAVVSAMQGVGGDLNRTLIPADCSYDSVTVYGYTAATGPADHQGSAVFTETAGTSVGSSLPLQNAVVVSLHTARPGRRGRGRMYLPITAFDLTDHQLGSPIPQNIADYIQSVFQTINGSASVQGGVCVLSNVDAATHVVTSVVVNSRLDIQRRRANSEAALGSATVAI